MDLIYTDKDHNDVGVAKNYKLDLAFGSDENDFELILPMDNPCCEADGLIYIEDTEYGGIVDGIGIVTMDDKLVYCGRTWHGILASNIIQPDSGKAYLTVLGEANTVINDLIIRLGLSNLFTASSDHSGLMIKPYSFDRYIDAYTGIRKMLSTVSAKLKIKFTRGKVVLSAVPIVDYSKDEQFDNDNVELELEKKYNTVNHLICLGKGELENRQVIHLYIDAFGNISDVPSFLGLQEITLVYDCPNAESEDELRKDGIEKLQEYAVKNNVQLNLTAEESTYDVGDIIGAKELTTNTFVTEQITKKIVTIERDSVNIQYKVGE